MNKFDLVSNDGLVKPMPMTVFKCMQWFKEAYTVWDGVEDIYLEDADRAGCLKQRRCIGHNALIKEKVLLLNFATGTYGGQGFMTLSRLMSAFEESINSGADETWEMNALNLYAQELKLKSVTLQHAGFVFRGLHE